VLPGKLISDTADKEIASLLSPKPATGPMLRQFTTALPQYFLTAHFSVICLQDSENILRLNYPATFFKNFSSPPYSFDVLPVLIQHNVVTLNIAD
jgi:hypothetical protein